MKPYDYQQKDIDTTLLHLETEQRVLYQLSTGGGKTAYFSFLSKQWKHGNVLVLAHRDELIDQTMATLRTIGVTCESIIKSKKKLQHHSKVYVGMVQTLKNRLRKDPEFCKDVSLIIIDEAHLLMHEEIFTYFPKAKIVAVTATPTVLKKINFTKCARCDKIHDNVTMCCNLETYEYTRDFTLSEIYESIIIGKSITELIEDGKLVRDIVYATGSCNRNNLKVDSNGEFKDTDSEFANTNALADVVGNYEQYSLGKKTIIFNSSAKVNQLVLEMFLEKGYTKDQVKLFDSVNETENRKKVLRWFKETSDAILLNVNCFTTGFDEPTVQTVITNRATKSLSLYHQMVGRGGRKCDDIYKPYFNHIDLGGNVEEFGKWSDHVDWESIFYGKDKKPKPKREALENTKQCDNCGMIYQRNIFVCPNCQFEPVSFGVDLKVSKELAKAVDEIPKPNGKKIVDYCNRIGKDKNFAWIVLQNQIVDMFVYHSVTEGSYLQSLANGTYLNSVKNLIKEPYQSIQGSDLESGTMRTKAYLIKKITNKLDKYYEKRT